jgi:hypothetical protein
MSSCPSNSESKSDSTIFNYSYRALKDVEKYKCEVPCLCRLMTERSSYDKSQKQWIKNNMQINLPPASIEFINSWK